MGSRIDRAGVVELLEQRFQGPVRDMKQAAKAAGCVILHSGEDWEIECEMPEPDEDEREILERFQGHLDVG